jgi:hypothetical protein
VAKQEAYVRCITFGRDGASWFPRTFFAAGEFFHN